MINAPKSGPTTLTTERLILRPWRDADRAAVAEILADPAVMRFFHLTRNRAQSDLWVDRTQAHLDRHGFGILAVEAPGVAELIGFAGLSTVPDSLPCAPAVEAVWTFGAPWWRRGYCAEAARAVLHDGFTRLGLREIVAFTAAANLPSQGVMHKIGMIRDFGADFGHPMVPAEHPMHPHVLYRMRRPGGEIA